MDLTVENNCVLLAQEAGDRTDRTTAVKLGGGANCLRIEALDNDTRLKIKLKCTK